MSTTSQSPMVRIHLDRGIEHLKRGEFAAAVAVCGLALNIEDTPLGRMLRGRALARMGRNVEALNDLDAAICRTPNDANALSERGAILIAMGRTSQALGDFNAAIRCGTKRAECYFRRGAALFNLADWTSAAADFSAVLEQKPHPQAWLYRGLCRRQLEDADGAIADFTAALDADPTFADALRERAKLLAVQGKNEWALADADRWITARPREAEAYSLRGELHHRIGNVAQSLQDYRNAVEFAPIDPKAINRLAWALATCADATLQNGTEARELAERAVELTRRDDPIILDTLAAAQAECGDFTAAIATISEALAIAPPAIHTELTRHRERLLRSEPIRDRESLS